MKIFITGGSGFVGTALSRYMLQKGHTVTAVGTSPGHTLSNRKNFNYISADTTKPGAWQKKIYDVDAVINLAGRNIFRYWTKSYKKKIYDSRILTTRNIVNVIYDSQKITLINASAAGYYGDRGERILQEDVPPGDDFLAQVCIDWEKEAFKAKEKRARVVTTRFGVVLGSAGGALRKMMPFYKYFLGGPLGNGRQWFPWIHIDDLVSAIDFALENTHIDGPLNFTSPDQVRNKDFAKMLGGLLNCPTFMPAPDFMIRTIMGELGNALLSSQRAVPETLTKSGFKFQYFSIINTLDQIINSDDLVEYKNWSEKMKDLRLRLDNALSRFRRDSGLITLPQEETQGKDQAFSESDNTVDDKDNNPT